MPGLTSFNLVITGPVAFGLTGLEPAWRDFLPVLPTVTEGLLLAEVLDGLPLPLLHFVVPDDLLFAVMLDGLLYAEEVDGLLHLGAKLELFLLGAAVVVDGSLLEDITRALATVCLEGIRVEADLLL